MKKRIENFDLDQIAESGQCFRWRKLNMGSRIKGYSIPAMGHTLIAIQDGNNFQFSCEEEEWEALWKDYFDMDRNYSRIGISILESDDAHLMKAFEFGSGIRILRQDLWEVIFSFMISQNNNIPRIKKTIEAVCERCALESNDGTENIPRMPYYDEIPLEIFEDSSFGFGYRASYLKEMCIFLRENPSYLRCLYALSYEDAMKELLKRKGIGEKVANCICLFGLGHVEAFPVDTHVNQLIEKHYKSGLELDRYKDCAGIIQQYLFYYDLKGEDK